MTDAPRASHEQECNVAPGKLLSSSVVDFFSSELEIVLKAERSRVRVYKRAGFLGVGSSKEAILDLGAISNRPCKVYCTFKGK